MTVNILGTEYTVIETSETDDEKLDGIDGYCDTSVKICVIDDMGKAKGDISAKINLDQYKRQVKRHELIHAFLHESGLDVNSWASNEEMVDWIAIQFPKMLKAFAEAEAM